MPTNSRVGGCLLLALFLLAPLFLASCNAEQAQLENTVQLQPTVLGLEDTGADLQADQALALFLENKSAEIFSATLPSLGFQENSFWFFSRITNTDDTAQRYLIAGRPHSDYVDLYVFNSDRELREVIHHGDRIAWSDRPYSDNELIFPLTVPAGDTSYLVFKMTTTGSLELPLSLLDQQQLSKHKFSLQIFTGLFFGAILAMSLFNLLLFIAIRDSSYLLYVAYLMSLSVFLLARSSLAFQLFWPDQPWLNDIVRAFSALIGEGFAILFASAFLRLSSARPNYSLLMRFAGCAFIVAAVASLFFSPAHTLRVATSAVALVIPLLLVAASLRLRDGFKPARYFLLSFLPIALLVPLFVLKTFAIIQSNWLIDHAFEIGSSVEAWLLSFALAYRLTMLKSENDRIQREATIDLEHRVQERTEELNQALNARSEFLAVMSHEIRTPLNGILGTVDMLKDSRLDDEQRRQMHVIEQSGNTLVELINDILDYARIEAGKLPIDEEQFNLPGLIRESVALFEHRARINGNQLRIDLDENIGLLCRGDPIRLRQIIVNLTSNAVKFTERGEVIVSAKRDPNNATYALFEIRDSGIGIERRQLSHLFELFQQADSSTRRRYGGAGLGLAICRQLVELMGGEIGVESEPSKGSHFWFRLPLPEVSHDQRRARQNEEIEWGDAPKIRLLIVDDNHVNLLVAQGLAKKLGHDVEVAETGPEAIAVLLNDSRPFDLVLMDCEMPEMDGFETSREIIRLQNEGKIDAIPIVALTAHAVPDKIRLCHEAGMVSHIAKPINSKKLDREIRSVLKHGTQHTEGKDENSSPGRGSNTASL